MDAVEFRTEDGKPDAALTARLRAKCLEKGVLFLACGSDHNVIRFIAPLNVSKEEMDIALKALDESLAELA